MSLVIGINSYVSLEEAEDIIYNELYPQSPEVILWEAMDDRGKELVCKKGTLAINSLEFIGVRPVLRQGLKFPRLIDGIEVIPEEIKIACVINGLMERVMMDNDNYKLIKSGVKGMTVGPNSVTLDNERFKGISLFDEALMYINKYVRTSISM